MKYLSKIAQLTISLLCMVPPAISQPLVIDANDKEEVTSLYQQYYCPLDRINPDWDGDLTIDKAGSLSTEYLEAARDRLYFIRALAGMNNSIALSPSLTRDAQRLSHLVSANHQYRTGVLALLEPEESVLKNDPDPYSTILHYYPKSLSQIANNYVTFGGSLGQSMVNLTRGDDTRFEVYTGLSKFVNSTKLMTLLDPGLTSIGVGSVSLQRPYISTFDKPETRKLHSNALFHEIDQAVQSEEPILWPPNGYVPYPLVGNIWSARLPGADFRTAYISMKPLSGTHISVFKTETIEYNDDTPIDTISWEIHNNHVVGFKTNLARAANHEIHHQVTIGNVFYKGSFRDITYVVKIYDPQPDVSGSQIEVSLIPKVRKSITDFIKYKVFTADGCLLETDISASSTFNMSLRLHRGSFPEGPFTYQEAYSVPVNADNIIDSEGFDDGFYRFTLGLRTSTAQPTDTIVAHSEVLHYAKTYGFRKRDSTFPELLEEKSLFKALENLMDGESNSGVLSRLESKLKKLKKRRRRCRSKKRSNTCSATTCKKRCRKITKKFRKLKDQLDSLSY